jgi:hypothetical protein
VFLISPCTPIFTTSGEKIIMNGQPWETAGEPNLLMNHGNGRYYGRITFVGKEKMGYGECDRLISTVAFDFEWPQ